MKKVLVSFRRTCEDYDEGRTDNTEALRDVYQFADELVSTTMAVIGDQEDNIASLTNTVIAHKLSAVERERVLHVINRELKEPFHLNAFKKSSRFHNSLVKFLYTKQSPIAGIGLLCNQRGIRGNT